MAAPDDHEEATYVVGDIQRLKVETGLGFDDFAVLFRTNAQSRLLEEGLRERGIPYRVVGGQSFFDRREVKDVIAYLRLLLNPADDVSLLRIVNAPPQFGQRPRRPGVAPGAFTRSPHSHIKIGMFMNNPNRARSATSTSAPVRRCPPSHDNCKWNRLRVQVPLCRSRRPGAAATPPDESSPTGPSNPLKFLAKMPGR